MTVTDNSGGAGGHTEGGVTPTTSDDNTSPSAETSSNVVADVDIAFGVEESPAPPSTDVTSTKEKDKTEQEKVVVATSIAVQDVGPEVAKEPTSLAGKASDSMVEKPGLGFESGNSLNNVENNITSNANPSFCSKLMNQVQSFYITHPKQSILLVLTLLAGILCAILIPICRTPPPPPPPVPHTVDYSTGVSLITQYEVQSLIQSRLAQTKISMEFVNGLNCSSVHLLTLQLPLDARVTQLQTIQYDEADDSQEVCRSSGQVNELEEARDTFLSSAEEGLPVAYVEVTHMDMQDSFTYSVQVSIPPLGTSHVELVVEQLLRQKLGGVRFEVPLVPNEEVDRLVLDLEVVDWSGREGGGSGSGEGGEGTSGETENVGFVLEWNVDGVEVGASKDGTDTSSSSASNNTNATNERLATDPIHLDIPDARQYDLPTTLRGHYTPQVLPSNGLLYAGDKCFEHYFQPSSLEPMPRNIIFLVDTSYSMKYDDKLQSAKSALKSFIDTLTPQDQFTIQTFGERGTIDLWGSGPGTEEEKSEAKAFINGLNTSDSYYGTNLHEALLEALLRAKRYDEDDAEETSGTTSTDSVTILLLLTDGYATEGETNRARLAKHVYDLNKSKRVKIFSMGFEGSADMVLLDAIALMNGGVSSAIHRGQREFQDQIEGFLESEFGRVLVSDVTVGFESLGDDDSNGGVTVFGQTQQTFPLLADGYEVVVRGLFEAPKTGSSPTLVATTSAATVEGAQTWTANTTIHYTEASTAGTASLCYQSYAHARITQLLRYHDAAQFLGDDLIKKLITLRNGNDRCTEEKFSDCIKQEAIDLAIDAKVVAKGLTAMVTVDGEQCMKKEDEGNTEFCLDGTTPDGSVAGDSDYYYDESDYGGGYYSSHSSEEAMMYDGRAYWNGAFSRERMDPFAVLLWLWLYLFLFFCL